MQDLQLLVQEALDRRRETRMGCFVSNAAAIELFEFGVEAVPVIEEEVLTFLGRGNEPTDLDSVLVIYARLVRKFDFTARCLEFLGRLPSISRVPLLKGIYVAWLMREPLPGALPPMLLNCVKHIAETGPEGERRVARQIVAIAEVSETARCIVL